MDKDDWLNQRNNRKQPPWMNNSPFSNHKKELSFTTKLLLAIVLVLLCITAYRYQSSIESMLSGIKKPAPVLDPAPRSRVSNSVDQVYKEPAAPTPAPSPVERGQIYRCGNTYSNTPCTNGQVVEVTQNTPQQSTQLREIFASKEIYLCKDIYDRLTWESIPCSTNGRFMERIARVPANVSWEEQVSIARQQRDKAHAIATEQIVSVVSRPSTTASAAFNECQGLEQSIRQLDAACRSSGCSMRRLDEVREQRRAIRDLQFRLRC